MAVEDANPTRKSKLRRRLGILIQARMSSRRLPGKVLKPLIGKPVLAHVVERCQRVEDSDLLAIITSCEPSDDAIAAFAEGAGVKLFRGPLNDVAARFLESAGAFGLDAFVRVNADSPLLDPALIECGIRMFRASNVDLVTNVLRRTFPTGMSVEVVDRERFEKAYGDMDTDEREHVTLHYYRHPDRFRILSFESDRGLGDRTLSVDTPRDFERIERIVGAIEKSGNDYCWDTTVAVAQSLDALPRREELAP